jgi:peptidyl-dipeptidase Dcp
MEHMTENPFFEPWNTPFELPPFEHIRPEHFPPTFDRGRATRFHQHDRGAGAQRPALE